jgi:hypothetical protein
VNNTIRNETSLVLVVAVIFSAVAIPVLSGFLEPSQPPAVAAVQIGDPRDGDSDARDEGAPARQSESRESPPDEVERRQPAAPDRPTQPAPSAPADDAAEDDGGEAD